MHSADELMGDPQTDAEASLGSYPPRLTEAFENQRLVGIGDSDAVNADRQLGEFAVACKNDLDRFSRPVANGIGEQIFENLLDCHRIASCGNLVLDDGADPATDRSANGSLLVVTRRISAERSTSAVCSRSFPEPMRATSRKSVDRRT